MISESPWAPPVAAGLISLLWAGVSQALKRPAWAGLGLGLGAVVGVTLLLGMANASPRQLAERLPVLAATAFVLALPLAFAAPRWLVLVLGLAGALATGWWMSGAPMTGADWRRASPVLLAVGMLTPAALLAAGMPWRAPAAAMALAAGMLASGVSGPWSLLGWLFAAATLGQLGAGASMALAARISFAMLLAALVAGPVMARGAPQDWAAASAPLALLLVGSRIKGSWGLLVASLLAVIAVGLAWRLAGHR